MKSISKILVSSLAFGFISMASFAQDNPEANTVAPAEKPAAPSCVCVGKKGKPIDAATAAECKAQKGHCKKAKKK